MDATWLDECMLEVEAWTQGLLEELEAGWNGERSEVMMDEMEVIYAEGNDTERSEA